MQSIAQKPKFFFCAKLKNKFKIFKWVSWSLQKTQIKCKWNKLSIVTSQKFNHFSSTISPNIWEVNIFQLLPNSTFVSVVQAFLFVFSKALFSKSRIKVFILSHWSSAVSFFGKVSQKLSLFMSAKSKTLSFQCSIKHCTTFKSSHKNVEA